MIESPIFFASTAHCSDLYFRAHFEPPKRRFYRLCFNKKHGISTGIRFYYIFEGMPAVSLA